MIAENIKRINELISLKCDQVGRKREDVVLIAVSKNNPVSSIVDVLKTGVIDFGENRANELRDKYTELIEHKLNWHFIGGLQKNKVKYIINATKYIHSVESIGLAEEINKKAEAINKVQKVLIECNISNEVSKMGLIDSKEIWDLAEFIKGCSNLELKGLMTMAPYTDETTVIRKTFKGLKSVFDEMNRNNYSLTELSMGMTNDFEIGIEEGSTMLRIGTAIFGERVFL
ncbi:MAG: YggS family pyridoxal phosphate-dependent enzyme [bacterium]